MEIIANNAEKLERVKKRIEKIKSFYKHLSFYIIVNLIFIGRRIYKDIQHGDSIIDAIFDISNYGVFLIWGVFLLFHGFKVFNTNFLFGKNWEERKIKEMMG